MGYSGRYHAASLAAVFLALAIGILIGVGFGSDIVSGTAENLEESLGSDLTEAREEIEELEAALESERSLSSRLYPAVVGNRLAGEQVGIIAIGGLPEDVSNAVDAAIDPTGATLTEIAVLGVSPDADAAMDELLGFAGQRSQRSEALEAVGRRAGRQFGRGGSEFDAVRRLLLTRYSGEPGGLNDVVLFRQVPEDLDEDAAEDLARIESGLVEGLRASGAVVVGVERTDEETSSVEVFEGHGISSVDNVDSLAGQVALIFALGGTSGSFGVKETADRLLPDLLPPASGIAP